MPTSTSKRKRRSKPHRNELILKSREAALAAVQIFNNPLVTFKSELFIVTMCIAWTYLLHAYYKRQGVTYYYYETSQNGRRRYDKTKYGAKKAWVLETCINNEDCPLDEPTCSNLRFLIGIRHEIEHQMTMRIDDGISAKFQACVLNYNAYLKTLFGEYRDISTMQPISLQFSSVSREQLNTLPSVEDYPSNIQGFISDFEKELDEDVFNDARFSYRVLFVQKTANRKGQADKVIEFIRSDSELARGVNISYALTKDAEKKKYRPKDIVELMKSEGYKRFNTTRHTELWKALDAKHVCKGNGIIVCGQWYWYEKWVDVVRQHCRDNADRYE